jgi:polyphenol oxidase
LHLQAPNKLSNAPNPRFTGDSPEIFTNNRILLAEKLMIKPDQLVFPRQTHTNCVAEISDIPESEIKETDALVTNKSGICLCVQTADCVPILLYDPINNVIAAVHAGWRGTVKKITEIAVQKMVQKYNSFPQNIVAAIGPSICPEIYEVGNEVVEEVKKSIPNADILLHKNSSGKFHVNLWEANRQILLENGLHEKEY